MNTTPEDKNKLPGSEISSSATPEQPAPINTDKVSEIGEYAAEIPKHKPVITEVPTTVENNQTQVVVPDVSESPKSAHALPQLEGMPGVEITDQNNPDQNAEVILALNTYLDGNESTPEKNSGMLSTLNDTIFSEPEK